MIVLPGTWLREALGETDWPVWQTPADIPLPTLFLVSVGLLVLPAIANE